MTIPKRYQKPEAINKVEDKQRPPRIAVSNHVQPNPENPIPFQKQSLFYIPSGKSRYVPLFSDTDQFPNLLLGTKLLSTTHSDCIDTIVRCAIGNGIYVVGNDKPDKRWSDWVKSVNNHGQSLNKVARNVVDGFETQGNKFIEIVRGEVGGKRYMNIYPHPMQNCRLIEPNANDVCTAVYISKYFAHSGRLGTGFLSAKYLNKARQIPIWTANQLDEVWIDNGDGSQSTMIHLKNEVDGVEYYGLPSSIGSLLYQVKESLMVQYDNDNLNNNMMPGGVLGIKGSLSRSEVAEIATDIINTHTGRGKVGRWAVVASEQIEDIKMEQFKTEREGSYIETDKRNEEKIRSAHKLPAELSSAIKSGGLGNGGSYLLQAWNTFEALKLSPIRQELKDEFLAKVQIIFADHFGVQEVKGYDLGFQNPMSMLAFLDLDPKLCVTVNEARGWLNLPEDKTNGNKYMAEVGRNIGGQNV